MKAYTFIEAREKLASLLNQAAREGQVFVIKLYKRVDSPLNVKGLVSLRR